MQLEKRIRCCAKEGAVFCETCRFRAEYSDVGVSKFHSVGLHVSYLLFLLISVLLFTSVDAQLSEGDRCVTPANQNGICRPYEKCPGIKEQVSQGLRPKICGFNQNNPVICCSSVAVRPPVIPKPGKPEKCNQGNQTPRPTQRRGGGLRSQNTVSERKCEDYSKMVKQQVVALPLVLDPNPVSFAVENCPPTGLQLIVGGERTDRGEFPHMAAIGFRRSDSPGYDWDCGGSLISERFVLTAAHCTLNSKGQPAVVRIGELNLRRDEADGGLFRPPGYSNVKNAASSGDYKIESVTWHPDYHPSAKYHDIALLKLEKPVSPFTAWARPACLYTKPTFSVNRTTATGWGRIDFAEDPSDILLKVGLEIIDANTCNKLYASEKKTEKLTQGITSSMMCAGELAGGKDTCQGDSGGPIQIHSPENRCIHYIIGVTSFGKICAFPNSPGVYTRVSHYVPWIESIVWPCE